MILLNSLIHRHELRAIIARCLEDTSTVEDQIRFTEMIIDHLTQKGIMDAGLLYEQPFTGLHYEGLDGLFSSAVADEIVSAIDLVNANAEVHVAA